MEENIISFVCVILFGAVHILVGGTFIYGIYNYRNNSYSLLGYTEEIVVTILAIIVAGRGFWIIYGGYRILVN